MATARLPKLRLGAALLLPLLMAGAILLPRWIMGPRLVPLHDVGFNLEVLADLDQATSPAHYLATASRHRPERYYPAYWLWQHVLWRLGGRSLDLFLPANLVLLALVLFAVGGLARRLGGNPFLAMLLLLAAPGVVENTHTIMKQELPLAAAQAWLALWLLKATEPPPEGRAPWLGGWFGAAGLILFSGLLKETSAMVGGVLAAWALLSRQGAKARRPVLLLSGLALGLGVAAFLGRRPGGYTQAFSLAPGTLGQVAWAYGQALWPWLLYLPGAALAITLGRRADPARHGPTLVVLLLAGWAAVYLPWRITQIRYLLPAMAFLAPLGAAAWARTHEKRWIARLGAGLLAAGLVASLPLAAARAWEEGRARLAADRAVAELREWLVLRPAGATVAFLMPEDEPIQELRAQCATLAGRADLRLEATLQGRSLAEWREALVGWAQRARPGQLVVVPFAAGTPAYADRVFPADPAWSEILALAERTVLSPITGEDLEIVATAGRFRAGFRILRIHRP